MMRWLSVFALAVVLPASAVGQTLSPKPSTLQHVTVEPTVSASVAARGTTVTLWADVTPKPSVHVYASDRQGLTPVTLVLTPHASVEPGPVKYPVPEMAPTVGFTEPVPVYRKPFRLAKPITIAPSARSGEVVTIAGVVNYQACDDLVCYPTASVPVSWTFKVK